jgi:hypothetical protein
VFACKGGRGLLPALTKRRRRYKRGEGARLGCRSSTPVASRQPPAVAHAKLRAVPHCPRLHPHPQRAIEVAQGTTGMHRFAIRVLMAALCCSFGAAVPLGGGPRPSADDAFGGRRALQQVPTGDGYAFYAGWDTTGYDIKQMNGATVAQLSAACSADPLCWGFNSWGVSHLRCITCSSLQVAPGIQRSCSPATLPKPAVALRPFCLQRQPVP